MSGIKPGNSLSCNQASLNRTRLFMLDMLWCERVTLSRVKNIVR